MSEPKLVQPTIPCKCGRAYVYNSDDVCAYCRADNAAIVARAADRWQHMNVHNRQAHMGWAAIGNGATMRLRVGVTQ